LGAGVVCPPRWVFKFSVSMIDQEGMSKEELRRWFLK
jgi:hypothetical protein